MINNTSTDEAHYLQTSNVELLFKVVAPAHHSLLA
jgi:hypothetical protein